MANSSADSTRTAQALVGPFTLREALVVAGGILLLIGSVLPFEVGPGSYSNVWNFHTTAFNQVLTLALPVVVAGAFAWRRLAGRARVSIGSLTLDQLASGVAVLCVAYFFLSCVMSMNPAFLLGLLGALAMAAGSTLAPYVPGFVLDFAGGPEPVLARGILPSTPRPASASHASPDIGFEPPHGTTPEPIPGAWPAPGAEPGTGLPTTQATADAPAASDDGFWAGQDARHDAETPGAPSTGATAVGGGSNETAEVEADADASVAPESGADADAGTARGSGEAPTDAVPPAVDPSLEGPEAVDAAAGPEHAGEPPATSDGVETTDTAGHDDGAPGPAGEADAPATTAIDRPKPAGDAGAARDAHPETRLHPVAGATAAHEGMGEPSSFTATSSAEEAPRQQAFWFAVPHRRTTVQEGTNREAFALEPGVWILALEDRGDEFLVQDADGSVGVLRDLTRIERA